MTGSDEKCHLIYIIYHISTIQVSIGCIYTTRPSLINYLLKIEDLLMKQICRE